MGRLDALGAAGAALRSRPAGQATTEYILVLALVVVPTAIAFRGVVSALKGAFRFVVYQLVMTGL